MKSECIDIIDLFINPSEVIVRNRCNISVSFKLTKTLPKDSSIIFRFRGGRNNKNDWYDLQPYDPSEPGHVSLVSENGTKIIPLLISGKDLLIKYFILGPEGIERNSTLKLQIINSLVQSLVEKQKKIEIFVQYPDEDPILLENLPLIDIVNEQFDHVEVIAPSTISPNESFSVLLRFEDEYKNLVWDYSTSLKVILKDIQGAENYVRSIDSAEISNGIFKIKGLTIPKTGFYQLKIVASDLEFESNPIYCNEKFSTSNRLYWGYIHGHTIKSDGIRTINEYFENLINAGLDFGTSTEHDHRWETTDEDFKEIRMLVDRYNQEGQLISMFGYEYGTWYSGYGDICIYYRDPSLPVYRSELNRYNSTKKLIKNLKPYQQEILMIAHHTSLRPGFRNWDYFDNDLEPLVEIYSTWGNQEYPFQEGNPLPPRYKFFGHGPYAKKRGPILEKKGCFVKDALKRGYKLGFSAGGDDHFGVYPSGRIDPDNGIYPPGIFAVWTNQLTRETLWNAMKERHCYGTTGPRVIIEFSLNGFEMGEIIKLDGNPQLKEERNFNELIISPLSVKSVQLICNNEVALEQSFDSKIVEFTHIDKRPFDQIAFIHQDNTESFVFYYLRIFIEDDNMAWSSPIWIVNSQLRSK